jgi:cyclophilin family peptidyl-prolyl cis-trans isomerase
MAVPRMISPRRFVKDIASPGGDATVSQRWKLVAACLGLLLCAAAAGCNRGGETNPSAAAATGQPASTTRPKDGVNEPSLQKPAGYPQHPVVLIETSLGNIKLRLDAEKAFLTVDNFLTYVGEKFYDQTIVHQVYKGQGFLAGGYDTNLAEKRGRTPIHNEAQNGLKNRRYTIAMVRQPDLIDSATSQFFINAVDNPALDYKDRTPAGYGYCVFGEVVEGMEVVDKINSLPVHSVGGLDQTPVQPVVVKSIRQLP